MANPWDDDPIVQPVGQTAVQGNPWDADAIVTPRNASRKSHISFEEGQALLNAEEQQQRMEGASGAVGAALTGLANGVPVAGPALLGAGQRGAALASTVINPGTTYDENLREAQGITQQAQEEHPWVTTGANIAGAVGGTIPMIAAAPAAFGVGVSSTPVAMAAGGASGLAIGTADAGVRSDWDPWEMTKGGLLGLGIGAAGPVVGDLVGRGVKAFQSSRATADAARQAGTSPEAVDVVARAMGQTMLPGDERQHSGRRARSNACRCWSIDT